MRDEYKMGILLLLLVLVIGVLFALFDPGIWIVNWRPVPAAAPHRLPDNSPPPARFDEFIARYGPPTSEEQTLKGMLQPPLFTKWLDYEPEHLRVAFVAAETSGGEHGRSWILIAFLDSDKPEPLSAQEAGQRLMSRQK